MKAITTSKRFASVLALLLAIVMCFSACGQQKDTSSVASSGDASVTDVSSDAEVSSETEEQSSKEEKTSSTTTTAKSTKWDEDYLKTMPQSVKDKGVTILMWREMHTTEQKLLDDFVAKTGCKVNKVITTEQEYATKLVSLISAKESPDICALQPDDFPGVVTKAMQPLDAETFRLDDDCWNKDYMNVFAINGKYFSVAMPGSWSCEDCLYVTYYQPSVLKECGVSTMPYQLYKNGQWDWAAQKEIATKVSGAGKDYTGMSLQSTDLYMLSAGQDFATYDGKQFTNKLGSVDASNTLTKAWQEVATLNQAKACIGWDLTRVLNGKVGLFTSIAYGMYNEGNWGFDNIPGGFSSIEVVPVAGPSQSSSSTPSRPKTWGVPKGAKNPEGAAYFLRYWLDISNCDMDKTFITSQAKEVFDIISAKSYKKTYMYGSGVTDYVTAGTYKGICDSLFNATPANVTTIMNSKAGSVKTGVNRANKDLTRIK